jgi:hypothetical protein
MRKRSIAPELRDWTDGCIAVTNSEIEEVSELVHLGTTIGPRP